jgi:hypothetical protein
MLLIIVSGSALSLYAFRSKNIRKHLKVTQMLASGVAPKDAIDWNSETYKANGYHKDTVTGNVFYAPDGKNGQVYMLVDGKFVKARIF